MQERRGYPRALVSFPTRLFADEQLLLRGRALDLSLGGVLLHGRAPLRPGRTVRVEVARGGQRNPLVLPAEVVRIEQPTVQMRRHGVALRWLAPDLVDVAALALLLQHS